MRKPDSSKYGALTHVELEGGAREDQAITGLMIRVRWIERSGGAMGLRRRSWRYLSK